MNIFSYLYLKYLSCCLPNRNSQSGQVRVQPQQQPHRMAVHSQISNRSHGEKSISTLSSELNLASFAISSGVLGQLWDAISLTKVHFKDQLSGSDLRVQFKVKDLTKYNIIVFVASPITASCLSEKAELVPSPDVSGFDFLSSRRNPSFSMNKAALSLFNSPNNELSALAARIAKAAESKPYIIAGDGIGGSVASLFALQLLHFLDTKRAKLPLCVTFGSPLLGDSGLQRAISEYTTWNSCFLHVVSMDDFFPSLFVQPNHPAGDQTKVKYHPFGRFMFCSSLGGACFEDPESTLELLRKKTNAESGRNEQSFNYGSIVTSLRKGLICKDKTNLNANSTGSSKGRASVAAQYLAGLFELQDVASNSWLQQLVGKEMLLLDQKRETLERAAKELNDIKVYMTYMEWYKKMSEKRGIPYYDTYKNQSATADFDVNIFKGNLQSYWERQVREADQKPQKAGAALRDRWLLGGTTYRKMVEPLAIADRYKHAGAKNYVEQARSEGRLKHYKLLEQWFKEDQAKRNMEKQNALPPSLTEDSCFWAHVEEAIISCSRILNEGESVSSEIESLKKFEEYVLELIKKYEVSSDIFWEKSSFMKWWKEYEKILDKKPMGTFYTSALTEIMHGRKYIQYETGDLLL